MSVKDCLSNAIDTLLHTDALLPEDREVIAGSLQRFLDRPDLPDADAVQKLAFIMRDARRDMYIKHVSKLATQSKAEAHAARFDGLHGMDYVRAVREYVVPTADLTQRNTLSVEYRIRAEVSETQGRLGELWGKVFSFWGNDKDFTLDFRRAQLGMDASPDARRLAALYKEVTGALLDRIRNTGVYVGHIEHYMPRNWDYAKARGQLGEFTRMMKEHLDPAEHPDVEATVDRMLYHMEHADLQDPTQATISMARELKFKTPEGELETMLHFGQDGFGQQLMQGVGMLAKRAILSEHYGPNPRAAMKHVLDRAKREAGNARTADAQAGKTYKLEHPAAKLAKGTEALVDSHAGALANPHNQSLANWGGATRDWLAAVFLGRVGLAQLTMDSFNSMVRTKHHVGGMGASLTRNLTNLVKMMGPSQSRQFAERMGLWQHAFQMASAGRFHGAFAGGQAPRRASAKFATSTQRLSLAMYLENAFRSSMGLTVLKQMGDFAKGGWSDLPETYHKLLKNSGITPELWKQIRHERHLNELGVLDPSMMKAGPAREAVTHFLWREVDTGVIHPDTYDRWLLTFGTQSGTVAGEAAAASTQFWSWSVGFMRKMVWQEWQMGKTGFAGFAAGTTMLAAITTQLYALTSGEPMFEWDSPELWLRAANRSGLLSPIGGAALEAVGHGRLPVVGGPAVDSIIRVLRAGSSSAGRALDGELDRAARPLIQTVRSLAVPNYWWADAAVSGVMDTIYWEIDPQYMRDREKRFDREGRR